jgi:hypothetical protein
MPGWVESSWPFALAFAVAIVVDAAWAAYIIATAEKKAVRASLISSGIVLLAGTNMLLVMHDKRTLLAAAVGGFLGTYASIKFEKQKS